MDGGRDFAERESYTKKSFFPREGQEYTLADTLEMLYADSQVRGVMDSFDEVKLEGELAKMEIGKARKFMSGEHIRMILKKIGHDKFQIHAVFGVVPVNDRKICSDASAQNEGFGRSFMGLGGNSNVPKMF